MGVGKVQRRRWRQYKAYKASNPDYDSLDLGLILFFIAVVLFTALLIAL